MCLSGNFTQTKTHFVRQKGLKKRGARNSAPRCAFMLMGTHRWHSNDFRGRSFRFVVLFSAQYRPPKFHFRCKLYTTLFYIHASAIPFVKHHFQFKLSWKNRKIRNKYFFVELFITFLYNRFCLCLERFINLNERKSASKLR